MIRAADRDRVAGQPVGIAAAVPALVLVADDPRDRAHAGDRAQDPLADHGVLAHDLPLARVERAGLVEDLVGDPDLADVVKERGRADVLDLVLVERQASATRSVRSTTDSECSPVYWSRSSRACASAATTSTLRADRRRDLAGLALGAIGDLDAAAALERGRPRAPSPPEPGASPRSARGGALRCRPMPRRLAGRRPRPPRAPTRIRSSTICASPSGVSERSITNSSAPARHVRSRARVRPARQLADCGEDLVARRVAALHVEVAEAVDVEDRDGERAPVALGALDVELELGAERRQGHEAGDQRVAAGRRGRAEPRAPRYGFGPPGAQLRVLSRSLESIKKANRQRAGSA